MTALSIVGAPAGAPSSKTATAPAGGPTAVDKDSWHRLAVRRWVRSRRRDAIAVLTTAGDVVAFFGLSGGGFSVTLSPPGRCVIVRGEAGGVGAAAVMPVAGVGAWASAGGVELWRRLRFVSRAAAFFAGDARG